MPGDLTSLIAALPPWAQGVVQIGLLILVLAGGGYAYKKGHRGDGEKGDDFFDPSALLERSPIKAYLEAVQIMADHAKLQTEAQKTISAALVTVAKLFEDDFDERRIQREVDRRSQQMADRRSHVTN